MNATIAIIAAVLNLSNGLLHWHSSFPQNISQLPLEGRESAGWYNLRCDPPVCSNGFYAVADGYERIIGGYRRTYHVEHLPVTQIKYSTLSICRELRKIGKWDNVKSLLTQGGVWDDYYLANYLASDDPVFSSAIKAVVDAEILTQAQLDELLPKCIWTAE